MAQMVGVILAGGSGSRMGRLKGEIELDGRTLAERAGETLWPFCGSVICSHAAGEKNPAPRYPSVVDEPPAHRGPLAGLDAAFRSTGEADLLVLACDYPRVEGRLLRRLVSLAGREDDVVMFVGADGRDHPLVAVWRRSAEQAIRDTLEEGFHSVRGLLPDLKVRRIGPAEMPGVDLNVALLNLNWPADLEKL